MNLTALALLGQLALTQPQAPVLDCGALPSVFQSLKEVHYAQEQVVPVAGERSVENFVRVLDPSRTLLLASDVTRLEKELPGVFRTMLKGNCGVLDSAWNLIISRSKANEEIVKNLLGPKYKLDTSVEIDFDPKRRGHAKTEQARADVIRKMVHFQISNTLQTGASLEEAKKRVFHRYELATRRLRETASNRELPGLYAEAFASALDPHSSFLSAQTLADFEISMRLSLEGIGAALTSRDGFTIIQSIVPGGQADKQNILRPKDKIMAVAQDSQEPVSTIDMDLRDVVSMIRGKSGTKVTLTVLREGKETKTFDVTIIRGKIDVQEQAAKIEYETKKAGGRSYKVGIIELPSFYGGDEDGRSAYTDMKRLLAEARSQKVDGIVLDLSGNGGGLLRDAVRISGLFLRSGAVVATKSSLGDIEVLSDDDESVEWNGPLVLLTSPASASASEILAGALKDYERAVIVGSDHTFGKGSVQILTALPGGVGAIKVTTGMFFLPSGKSTQRIGVPSDVVVPTLFDSYDIGEENLDYSLPPQSTRPFKSSTVNAKEPARQWRRISPAIVKALAAKSKARVAKNEMLQELKKQLADAEKNRGVVKLADLRKEAEKSKKDSKEKKAEEEEEEETEYEKMGLALKSEAVDVLLDLVTFR